MSNSTAYLDPLNQAFADAAAALPPLQDLTVEQFRAEVEQLQQHTPTPGVTRTEFVVDFEDGVKTYIFKPDGSKGNLPVVFFFHGGAWIAGRYAALHSLRMGADSATVSTHMTAFVVTLRCKLASQSYSRNTLLRLKHATQRSKNSATR